MPIKFGMIYVQTEEINTMLAITKEQEKLLDAVNLLLVKLGYSIEFNTNDSWQDLNYSFFSFTLHKPNGKKASGGGHYDFSEELQSWFLDAQREIFQNLTEKIMTIANKA
jgi:hypothetical protein